MFVVVAVVGLMVVSSVALFVVGVLDRRSQRRGLAWAILASVLYVIYYGDVLLPQSLRGVRDVVMPLGAFGRVDGGFSSSVGVALALVPIQAIQAAIFLRVTVDTAVGHMSDRIVNFVSGVTALVLFGAIVVSALDGGAVMAGCYAACAMLVYALAASSRDIEGLTAGGLRHVWLRSTRAASAFVVRCASVVSSIIAVRDWLGVAIANGTSRLQAANERQREELRRQRESENNALVERRRRRRHGQAEPDVGGEPDVDEPHAA